MSCHRLSIGLKSGLWPDRSNTFRFLEPLKCIFAGILRVVVLKVNLPTSFKSLTDWNRFSSPCIFLHPSSPQPWPVSQTSLMKNIPLTWCFDMLHSGDGVLIVGVLPTQCFVPKAKKFNFGLIRPDNLVPRVCWIMSFGKLQMLMAFFSPFFHKVYLCGVSWLWFYHEELLPSELWISSAPSKLPLVSCLLLCLMPYLLRHWLEVDGLQESQFCHVLKFF